MGKLNHVPVYYLTYQLNSKSKTGELLFLMVIYIEEMDIYGMDFYIIHTKALNYFTYLNIPKISESRTPRVSMLKEGSGTKRMIVAYWKTANGRTEVVYSMIIMKPYFNEAFQKNSFIAEVKKEIHIHTLPFPVYFTSMATSENTIITHFMPYNSDRTFFLTIQINNDDSRGVTTFENYQFYNEQIFTMQSLSSCITLPQELVRKCAFTLAGSVSTVTGITYKIKLDGERIIESTSDYRIILPSDYRVVHIQKGQYSDLVFSMYRDNPADVRLLVFDIESKKLIKEIPKSYLPAGPKKPHDLLLEFKELSPDLFLLVFQGNHISSRVFRKSVPRIDFTSDALTFDDPTGYYLKLTGTNDKEKKIPLHFIFSIDTPISPYIIYTFYGTLVFLVIAGTWLYWYSGSNQNNIMAQVVVIEGSGSIVAEKVEEDEQEEEALRTRDVTAAVNGVRPKLAGPASSNKPKHSATGKHIF